MSRETVKMPKELTAENGSKYLMSGEFKIESIDECLNCDQGKIDGEHCESCGGDGYFCSDTHIPWATIKEIYSKLVNHHGQPIEAVEVEDFRAYKLVEGENFVTRLINEHQEIVYRVVSLVDKLDKILQAETCNNIDDKVKGLVVRQLIIMQDLEKLLTDQINVFKVK